MTSMLRNCSFHHIEVPCDDLELAERFYLIVFGAHVYLRRDASRRAGAPTTGTISEAEERGFQIDGTYLKIGTGFRIGFLKRRQEHAQSEIDHLAFTIDDEDLTALGRRLTEYKIEVVDQSTERMLIRDPFGLMLELWPTSVLQKMGCSERSQLVSEPGDQLTQRTIAKVELAIPNEINNSDDAVNRKRNC